MKKLFFLQFVLPSLALASQIFNVPTELLRDVAFWSKVYREWGSHQVVFYDGPTKTVFEVMSLPKVSGKISSPQFRDGVKQRFDEIASFFNKSLEASKIKSNNQAENNMLRILQENGMIGLAGLGDRLRFQNGLRDQFEYGLKVSGQYASEMNAILKSQDLPTELLAMVFVESLFYLSANSHANAAGPWGILADTARHHGIFVNSFADERIDPAVSTFAAARYLKRAKEGLGEWPLAITAYNFGYSGMMRAKKKLATDDLMEIIASPDSPLGYASRNYYAEFLAALDTMRNYEKYFPTLKKAEAWKYDLVQVLRPVFATDLIEFNAMHRDELISLNPSLSQGTIRGHEVIPPNYALRVPDGREKYFYERLKKIPNIRRTTAATKVSTKHFANGHKTLHSIASEHGISLDFLSNKLGKPSNYRPSGTLLIRSQAFLFSSLLDIRQRIKMAFASDDGLKAGG